MPESWNSGGEVKSIASKVLSRPTCRAYRKLWHYFGPGRPKEACLRARQSYIAHSPQRQTLRFSRSGDPAIEALYRTHWVSQELSERKRQRLAEKANRAPDIVVVQPLKGMEVSSMREIR
jgi:hypothetical protein